ncbi:MAG: sulfite exporter TauE/SafE family protein, partial [Epsilonproteobacteria bacterium]|nr:sulfite exporter TauE/SafE family protein [Campylobacterota bacterium]
NVDYKSGIIIGLASLFGVYLGIFLKHNVAAVLQKRLLILFYVSIVLYLAKRVFLS